MALSAQGSDFTGIALCAGYGGLELGLHISEPRYRTVCYVEREGHAAATLVARMADQALDQAPIWDDVKSFDGRPWRGKIHILSAGYPCQPFSTAGRRRGTDDPRHLWPHVARVVSEVRPDWVFLENVLGHLALGFPEVGGQLRGMGYGVKAGVFTADEVGAHHVRPRLFALAHADGEQQRQPCRPMAGGQRPPLPDPAGLQGQSALAENDGHNLDALLDDAAIRRLRSQPTQAVRPIVFPPAPSDFAAWHQVLGRDPDLQPALYGMADGMAERLDELRGAGNGVCSLAAAHAFRTLKAAFDRGREPS